MARLRPEASIRHRYKRGATVAELALAYGISQHAVRHVVYVRTAGCRCVRCAEMRTRYQRTAPTAAEFA